jgi:hypothetical protein
MRKPLALAVTAGRGLSLLTGSVTHRAPLATACSLRRHKSSTPVLPDTGGTKVLNSVEAAIMRIADRRVVRRIPSADPRDHFSSAPATAGESHPATIWASATASPGSTPTPAR